MTDADLAATIDAAWEARDGVSPTTAGAVPRGGRGGARRRSMPARLRVAEKTRRRLAGQSVAQEGGAAVLPAQRHGRDPRRPGDPERGAARWWDKVPSKFAGWASNRFRDAGFRAVPGCDRAPLGLYRAERRADAELRQCRRLCRQRHDGRHLGDRRLLRADRQELPPLGRRRHRRRARAAAGRAGDHRGQLLHRRAQRGGRGRDRRDRRGAVDGRLHRRVDQDRRPRHRRDPLSAACRPIRWWCRASLPGKPLPDGSPGPSLYCAVIVKRSTSRPAPRPRSTSCCGTERMASALDHGRCIAAGR